MADTAFPQRIERARIAAGRGTQAVAAIALGNEAQNIPDARERGPHQKPDELKRYAEALNVSHGLSLSRRGQ